MKSLEQEVSEAKDKLRERGMSADEISEVLKDKPEVEQKLRALSETLKTYNPNPFVRHNKIARKNGSAAVVESVNVQEVEQEFFERLGMKTAPKSEDAVKQLAESWKEYCPVLTSDECQKLAEMGKKPGR